MTAPNSLVPYPPRAGDVEERTDWTENKNRDAQILYNSVYLHREHSFESHDSFIDARV